MIIYIGADHRGFKLKEHLKGVLAKEAYEVVDAGALQYDANDDYPDFARAVAEDIAKDPLGRRSIVICGSSVGADIAANKVNGIRSALALSPDHIYQARHDDDVNVLALAADFIADDDAEKIVKVFLSTPFDREEKYLRRIGKIGGPERI